MNELIAFINHWLTKPRTTKALFRLIITARGQWGTRFLQAIQEEKREMALEHRELKEIAQGPWVEVRAAEDARKMKNREAVLRAAAEVAAATGNEVLSNDAEGTAEVDADWWMSFWAGAEAVSNEQMQGVWARILAGECAGPGAFSLRTLSLVRVLSAADAQIFHKWCGRTICDNDGIVYVPKNSQALSSEAVMEITRLRNHGLVSPVDDLHMSTDRSPYELGRYGGSQKRICVSKCNFETGAPVVDIFLLTQAGSELLAVANPAPDDDYLRTVMKTLQDRGWTAPVVPQSEARLPTLVPPASPPPSPNLPPAAPSPPPAP